MLGDVMKVVTLLPAATEIVAALAPESLVGVSHECDYPAWVTSLPRVTKTSVDVGATSAEIDAQVRALKADGKPVICPKYCSPSHVSRVQGMRPRRTTLTS